MEIGDVSLNVQTSLLRFLSHTK
ncbi:MAG: hypothetical protein HQK97_03840 [Nitrospirae bacterium]|nr:hypothetical protein [Nitrospirota bacterium]